MNKFHVAEEPPKHYDVRFRPQPPPSTGIFDEPRFRVCINGEWASHVDGVLGRLAYSDAWLGTDDEVRTAIGEVQKLLKALAVQEESCGDFDVPVLTNIRVNDCVIEAQYDGIDDWVTIGAIADCTPAQTVVRDPGDGQLQQSFDGGDTFEDIENAHFLHINTDNDPLTGELEIRPVILNHNGQVIQLPVNSTGKALLVRNTAGVDKSWINADGTMEILGPTADRGLTLTGTGLRLDNNQRIFWRDSGGTARTVLFGSSNSTVLKGLGTAILLQNVGSNNLFTLTDAGLATFRNQTATTGKTQLAVQAGAGNISTDDLFDIYDAAAATLMRVRGTGQVAHTYRDSGTNNSPDVIHVEHETSGTPTTNFGAAIRFRGKSSTTSSQDMALLAAVWQDATHAIRKAQVVLSALDTNPREVLRGGTDGSAPTIGVLGATPSPRVFIGTGLDCGGDNALYTAIQAGITFGFLSGSVVLGTATGGGPAGPTGPQGPAGTNGTNGTNGQDGASAEMRVFDDYIQWRQDDDDPTWTNLVALDDLKGPQGNPGATGATGATGAQGEQGEPGECPDCGPVIPPPNPDDHPGENICCVASNNATLYLKQVVDEAAQQITLGATFVAVVIAVAAVIALVATVGAAIPLILAFVGAIIELGGAGISAVFDDALYEALNCALFCHCQDGQWAALSTIKADISATLDPIPANILNLILDAIGLQGLNNAAGIGNGGDYDCDSCGCEEFDCDDFEIFVSAETSETCVPDCVLEIGAIYTITFSGTFTRLDHGTEDGMYGSVDTTPQTTNLRRFFYSTNNGDNWQARPDQTYNSAHSYSFNVEIPGPGPRSFCFRIGSTGWEDNTGGLTVHVEKQP